MGASIFLLPAFAEAKNAGLNLLVFFGLLYCCEGWEFWHGCRADVR